MFNLLLLASGRSYHATRWASALSQRGINVHFASIHPVERPIDQAVSVHNLSATGKSGYVIASKEVKNIIKVNDIGILHAHYATGYGMLGMLTNYKPSIISVYGADIYEFPHKSLFHKYLLNKILSSADITLSTSESMADKMATVYPQKPRAVVTPFGVDIEQFKPSGKSLSKGSVFSIGIVKKLEKKYGIDVLIRAHSLLNEKYPDIDIQLDIVGEGSEKEALQSLASDCGLIESINFHGAILNSEVPKFLADMDVFCVPSRYESESFGVAAVEASACGVPVVVSDVGGLPEVVDNEETGLVVPKEDPHALCSALERLLNDRTFGDRLGVNGRQKVERLYDWEMNVEHVIDIYNNLIAQNTGADHA